MKKRTTLFVFMLFAVFNGAAQQIPGLQFSNYGGLYRTTYNPSILGGSRYKFQLNIASLGGSINHRYFVFLGKNALLYPLLTPHSTKEMYGRSRTMGSLVEREPLYLTSEIRWPSVMFSIGRNHGVAIQVRSRGYVQGENIPDPLRNLYFKRLDTESTPAIANQPWGDFSLVQQSFSEASASYGFAIINSESQKLKIGATVKYIFGARVGYLYGSADSFSIRSLTSETSELVVNNLRYETGYSQAVQPINLGNLFDRKKYGSGWGYDMGISYELGSFWARGKEGYDMSPEYLVRLSASVTDIGSIKYNTENSLSSGGNQSQMIIGQASLETISDKGPEGFLSLVSAAQNSSMSGTAALPQAWHVEADFQLLKGFFLNFSKTQRYKPANNEPLNMYTPNVMTITPRFEDEDSDIAFPVSFINGNKKVAVGAVAHLGPIFLGFSNINGLIKKTGGSMAYIGVSVWKLKSGKRKGKTPAQAKPEWEL